MPIYTIRTTSGREDVVIDMLESNVRAEGTDVKSIFHPAEIKGYIFVEGGLGAIQKSMRGLMHAKGLIEKPVALDEIRHFLERKKTMIRVSEADMVEIIGGPFRGERGEIKRVDKVKDEVTIELLEASIPIPVTIATEFIKIVKKAKPDEERPKPAPKPAPEAETDEEEPKAKPASQQAKESKEESAFDLKALKEREEARLEKDAGVDQPKPEPDGGKPSDQPAAEPKEKTKISLDELKKDLGEDNPADQPAETPDEDMLELKESMAGQPKDDDLKGGILEELEMEEKKKKKKRLADLEELDEGE